MLLDLLLPLAGLLLAPPPAQDAEIARLVPADAVFVLRLESVDGLLEVVNAFASVGDNEPMDAGKLLGDMDLPGDAGQVDPSRPLLLAVAASPQTPQPVVTFVLPVRDAQAYQGSLADQPKWHSATAGGYVGVSAAQGYALAAEPSALAAGLRPGVASMRLDLATLIAAYRPIIQMGLDQVEMQLDMLAGMAEGPVDIGPMLELYLDMVWDFIDSADRLDLGLVQTAGSLELAGSLSTLEGSPMAAWGGGAPADLTAWPGQVDPEGSLVMAMGGDWANLMKRMQPMLDVSFALYPPETRKFFDDYMAASAPLFPLMGPVFAGGEFGPGGMRLGYVVRSEKPQELLSGMTATMAQLAGGDPAMGISFTAPEPVEVGGVKAQRMSLEIDYDVLASSMGEELGEEQRAQMSAAMATLYGAGPLEVTLAAIGQGLVATLGGDEAFARRVLTAPAGPAARVPADLRRALAAASGGSPAFVYRFDLGRMTEQVGSMAAAFGEDAADLEGLPTAPMPMTMWGAIRGREWSGGMALDIDATVGFMSAIVAREEHAGGAAEEPFEFEVFGGSEAESRAAVVRAEMTLIEAGLALFSVNNGGRYPDTLEVLVMPDENGESYLDEIPLDPWGNAYLYELREGGKGCRLTCHGSDGAPGGDGEAADIVSTLPRR